MASSPTGTTAPAPAPTRADPPLPGLVQEHLPLVLTGAVFFVVIARLLVLAKFDAVTARAILANAGPTQVILGTLVTSLPWVLVIIAIGLPILFRMEGRGTDTFANVMVGVAAVLAVWVTIFAVQLGLYSLPWFAFGVTLGGAVLVGVMVELDLRGKLAKDDRRQRRIFVLAVVLFANVVVVGSEPWLPAKRIERTGKAPIVAYVLDETDDELVVLEHEDRRVTRLDRADVETREICRINSPVIKRDTYDRCPD